MKTPSYEFESSENQRQRVDEIASFIKGGDTANALQTIESYASDGFDLNAIVYSDDRTFYEPTLFMLACAYANESVINALLNRGVNPKQKNRDGLDGYVHAAKNGELKVMKLLEQHGCSHENADPTSGATICPALFWAARYGRFEVVQYLEEEQSVDLQATGSEGYGLLHTGAESGNPDLVRYLLDKDFDPNAVGEGIRDMTPLMNAARMSDSPEVVQMLIDAGADVNKLDSFHRSALSWASYGEGKDEIKQVLLEAGADPQKEGETGVFALNVMSQDLGTDLISRRVQDLADNLLRDRYNPQSKSKKEDDLNKSEE